VAVLLRIEKKLVCLYRYSLAADKEKTEKIIVKPNLEG